DTGGDDIPGDPAGNGTDSLVNGIRDLIDFFPVYLNIRSLLQAFPSNSLTVWLKQGNSALNCIRPDWYDELPLYATNCLDYLTKTNIANALARADFPPAPTVQITSLGYHLPDEFVSKIRDQGKGIMLIEARAETYSPLVLE